MQNSEAALIADALAGDQKAYTALVDQHRGAIFHIINKIVRNDDIANDLVQETFMKAFALNSLWASSTSKTFFICLN